MSENNQLPVPISSGEIISAVANQLSILKKIIPGDNAATPDENVFDWYIRGCEKNLDGQLDEARIAFTKAIEFKPDDEKGYFFRGKSHDFLGILQQDINNDYTGAMELKSDCALAYYIHLAINDFTKAIELKPDYVDAYYMRATCYEDLGNYQQAIDDYTKVIELKPDYYVDAYYDRGAVYERLGNNKQAINDFMIAARLGDEAAQEILIEKGIQW